MVDPNESAPLTRADLFRFRSEIKSDFAEMKKDVQGAIKELDENSKREFDRVNGAIMRLAIENSRTNTKLDRLDSGLREEMRQVKGEVANRLDVFLIKYETIWRESATIPATLDTQGAVLRDHEKRLKRLEGA